MGSDVLKKNLENSINFAVGFSYIQNVSNFTRLDYQFSSFCAVASNSGRTIHGNEDSTNWIRHVFYMECTSLNISLTSDYTIAQPPKNPNKLTLMNNIGLQQNGICFIGLKYRCQKGSVGLFLRFKTPELFAACASEGQA